MVSLRSLSIVAALAATVAATPADALEPFGGICGRRDCTLGPDRPNRDRVEHTPRTPSPAEQQAISTNQSGIAALRAGNYRLALDYFRRALAMFPRERAYRHNVALALQYIAFEEYEAALAARDYARLDAILRMVDEADGLGGGVRANSRNLRRGIAATRRELATRAETARRQQRTQQLAQAREAELQRRQIARQVEQDMQVTERLNRDAQQLSAATGQIGRLIADRPAQARATPRGRSRESGLDFGEPGISEQNPVTRRGQDADTRRDRNRQGLAGATTAGERLDAMGRGRQSLSTGFDGGGDDNRAAGRPDVLPTVAGIGPERLERLNRDPRFREADQDLQGAREAVRRAEANQSALQAQQGRTTDPAERQRIQIAISNATVDTGNARDQAYRAEQRREQVIQTIEIEGAAIIEDGPAVPPPPPPPARNRRQSAPRGQ